MRSHGTAVACYRGYRPKTGTCDACRAGNAKRNGAAISRYRSGVRFALTNVRRNAEKRLG